MEMEKMTVSGVLQVKCDNCGATGNYDAMYQHIFLDEIHCYDCRCENTAMGQMPVVFGLYRMAQLKQMGITLEQTGGFVMCLGAKQDGTHTLYSEDENLFVYRYDDAIEDDEGTLVYEGAFLHKALLALVTGEPIPGEVPDDPAVGFSLVCTECGEKFDADQVWLDSLDDDEPIRCGVCQP